MRFPPVKAITTAVSKAANTNFNIAVQETPKYINAFKEEVLYKRINDINKWYTKIIGLDEVKLYQDRVFDLQVFYAQSGVFFLNLLIEKVFLAKIIKCTRTTKGNWNCFK